MEDEQNTLDTSKMARTDMSGLTYPAIWINKKLAYELGWFVNDPKEQDLQFAVKLEPNLVMKVNNYEIPRTSDIKSGFTADGHSQKVTHSDKYWIIHRWANGSLQNYIRLSMEVSWRFINFDYAFENVFGHSTRPLYVYSDVNASTVLGDQITDFIREVNYKREGKGSYYFGPTQLQYISLRKQLLDIIQVQVSEGTGHLVQLGNGITT